MSAENNVQKKIEELRLAGNRICVRTFGIFFQTIGREGLKISFCINKCPKCGRRQCGLLLPHTEACICGECDTRNKS